MTNEELQDAVLDGVFWKKWNLPEGKEFRKAVSDLAEDYKILQCKHKVLVKQNERFEESIDDKNAEIEMLKDKLTELLEEVK